MWNKPTPEQLAKIPRMYSGNDLVIYEHFFLGGCDWYAAEFDGGDTFFGYVILDLDYENSEWGSFSLKELDEINIGGIEVDRDCYWLVRPAEEVENICKGMDYHEDDLVKSIPSEELERVRGIFSTKMMESMSALRHMDDWTAVLLVHSLFPDVSVKELINPTGTTLWFFGVKDADIVKLAEDDIEKLVCAGVDMSTTYYLKFDY